jgi:cell wall-associated NlpC family hydrolase
MLAAPRLASADPIADKRAEANRLATQIDALGNSESALSERYDQAVLQAKEVDSKVADANAQLAKDLADNAEAEARVRAVALDAYVHASAPATTLFVPGSDPTVPTIYARVLNAEQGDALDSLRASMLQVHEDQATLASSQQAAKSAVSQLDSRRRQVVAAESQLNATLVQVKGQIADLVAQAEAAREAADRARAAALAREAAANEAARLARMAAAQAATRSQAVSVSDLRLSAAPSSITAGDTGPPVGSGAAAAVAEALRQVGKPYQWAAAGPDSFDCSGLTLWAWRAAGVSLPHYTGDQYASTTHISLSELQPGDLVYTADMGHMAMYIGGGNMVEAPHTGADVRVVPLRSDMVLASRP